MEWDRMEWDGRKCNGMGMGFLCLILFLSSATMILALLAMIDGNEVCVSS